MYYTICCNLFLYDIIFLERFIMNSPIKYPGGKNKELNVIIPNLPKKIDRFFEPFVGGGAVYFSIDKEIPLFINDKSDELINFYNQIKNQDSEFLETLNKFEDSTQFLLNLINNYKDSLISIYHDNFNNIENLYKQLQSFLDKVDPLLKENIFTYTLSYSSFREQLLKSIFDKYKRIYKLTQKHGQLEKDEDLINNITTGFISAYYTFNRTIYNSQVELNIPDNIQGSYYFYIREYCYSSMFRYNKNGKFNVPYGGMSYNKKSLTNKISYLSNRNLVSHLKKTTIENQDFYNFLEGKNLKSDDFLFLDPPYDTEFSTYANNTFEKSDQERLAEFLLNECPAKFMLIIKNSKLISKLYKEGMPTLSGKLEIFEFQKKYLVSFRNRNNKDANHLLITNYPINKKR